MALDPSNSSYLEQLALKGLKALFSCARCTFSSSVDTMKVKRYMIVRQTVEKTLRTKLCVSLCVSCAPNFKSTSHNRDIKFHETQCDVKSKVVPYSITSVGHGADPRF